MNITGSTIQQYTLPLTGPISVGKTQITIRQGLLLTLHTDAGLQGYGEIAPLPGLHHETLVQASRQLLHYQPLLLEISLSNEMLAFNGLLLNQLPPPLFPSVRTGIEMAIFDLLLQANPGSFSLPTSVPVNTLLDAEDDSLTECVEALLQKGFTSIKIKVARGPLEKDISDIVSIQSQIQNRAVLRLDANRRWTLDQAKWFCESISSDGIEYIEEPTQDPSDHPSLFRACGIPIALDETLAQIPCEQLDPTCCQAVILKPGVLGGFEKTAGIIKWARRHQAVTVISSAFESSLALRMYLLFAALNGITQIPLGLDTGKWFQQDLLLKPLKIEKGMFSLTSVSTRPEFRQSVLKPLEQSC